MTLPLWPARLHHLRRDSTEPERLARYYGELLDDRVEALAGGEWLVQGPGRRLIVGRGTPGAVPWFALAMQNTEQLANYAAALDQLGVRREASPTPLFGAGAFAVTDPDGRRVIFGLPASDSEGNSETTARLQHFVCATVRLPEMLAYYRETLGARESDRVLEGEDIAAIFLRTDPEHHSFAAFRTWPHEQRTLNLWGSAWMRS